MQNMVIAGLPNPVDAAVTTITAGAEGSSMQAGKLKTRFLNDKARLTSVFPHQSYWEVAFNDSVQGVRALALARHSLVPGDQVRVVGRTSGALPAVRSETLPPTAIEASVNMQATSVGVLDEHPSTTDNSLALPSVDTNPWSIRLSFGTPASTPAVGVGYQCFLARVRQVNVTADPADFPTVQASLYEGGTLRRVLGTKAFTLSEPGTDGRFVIFPWNASDLQTADGSAVEVLLEFAPGVGGTYGALDSVSWEVLSAADKAAANLDTGWETIAGAEPWADFGNTMTQEVDLPPPLWHKFITSINLTSARVEFRADGMGFFTSFTQTPPRTPNGFIDAGRLFVAPAMEMPYNFTEGGHVRAIPHLIGEESAIDGTAHGVIAYRRRECEVEFPSLPAAFADLLFERLDYAAGPVYSYLLSLEPNASGAGARKSTLIAYTGEGGGHSFRNVFEAGATKRSARYRFVEAL